MTSFWSSVSDCGSLLCEFGAVRYMYLVHSSNNYAESKVCWTRFQRLLGCERPFVAQRHWIALKDARERSIRATQRNRGDTMEQRLLRFGGTTMPSGDRKDPFRGFNFKLEIDGVQRAEFREVSGLDVVPDSTTDDEGSVQAVAARKLPGSNKHSNITLKRGITDDHSISDWSQKTRAGQTERKNGSIVLTDETGTPKTRWNFVNGWPTKFEGPSLNAKSNDVSIETLEITHQGLSKA